MDVVLGLIFTVLILLLGHWFRWSSLLGKPLPRIWAYVYGVLAILLPISGLYVFWILTGSGTIARALLALWAVVIAGGLSVVSAYLIDGWLDARAEVDVSRNEISVLKQGEDYGENS